MNSNGPVVGCCEHCREC